MMALCGCAAATRVHSRCLLRSSYQLSHRPCVAATPAVYEWSRTRTLSGGGIAAVGQQEERCEERPRRSLFSVPGADARKIRKAQRGLLGADCVVLDLEDGVARNQKDEARSLVKRTLLDATGVSSFGSSELAVRINGLRDTDDDGEDLALRDLEAVLPCPRLDAVVVPKVETAEDVHFVSRMVDELCCGSMDNRDVRILAAIESAVGMLNIRQIAETPATAETTASGGHPRLDALILASEDYCTDLELIRTTDALELLYARSRLVVAAKAHNLQAIDMVHVRFRDLEGLAEECQRGREMGFTGKQAIHPDQIDIIHEAFSPSQEDVDFALRVVRDYEEATGATGGSSGKGACEVDGIVVDAPVYKRAMIMLQRARVAGMLPAASR